MNNQINSQESSLVEEKLRHLDSVCGELNLQITRLGDRLNPVLMPDLADQAKGINVAAPAAPPLPPIVLLLNARINEIESGINKVNDVLHRLAI